MYDFNPEKETFNDTENAWIKHFATQAKTAIKGNQKAKTAQLTLVVKPRVVIKNLFTDPSDYEVVVALKYTSEAKTETATEPRLIVGIKTPLDTMSIALQDKRERN